MLFEQKTVEQTVQECQTRLDTGLTEAEVNERIARDGKNALSEKKPKTRTQMFLAQLNDPMIYILFAAVAISAVLKEYSDAAIILLVILINAVIGVVQEGKAQKALDALKKLSSPSAAVRREGRIFEIPAANLVVGDVVLLDAGRQVPADMRLVATSSLKVEESALTGESVPVEKDSSFVAEGQVPLGDRINMAYMTTSVAYGRGEGVVTAVGMNTEIGKIAGMINNAPDEMTPLQKRLADLGKLLGILAVILCAALFGIALLQKRDVLEMLVTAISLAVAAVPEGLPAVVTIVLALGVQRLVKVNTIVRKLPSVETLGSVSVVCSDKTGTLTQNKMTVRAGFADGQVFEVSALSAEKMPLFLRGFLLCNDASIKKGERYGDPTELALLDMGAPLGYSRETLELEMPRIGEIPFDSDRKLMTTLHQRNERTVSFTKGAPDGVLRLCTMITENGATRPLTDGDRTKILDAMRAMSAKALRVLALACRTDDTQPSEENLTFIGLVGMIDPPRPEAAQAVQVFKQASIRTVMITGDHVDTAFAIARDLGIAEEISQCISGSELDAIPENELADRVDALRVFARVSPENKVTIVKALKSKGRIVSMTGDGVNDAPSLKAADIGVAMGITGTDVAKSAADIVLTDDNFATIEKAVEEGRGIYANIKKSVLFLLSSNFGEIITMFLSILVGLAAPLKAIHILWVNLITDSLPGLALGVDENEHDDMMKQPPRNPKESLFANGGLTLTILYGAVIAVITLGAFLFVPARILLGENTPLSLSALQRVLAEPQVLMLAQTYAFTVLALSQLFHAVGMRNVNRSVFFMNHRNNKMMLLAFVVGFGMQIAVTEIPLLNGVFGTARLSLWEWLALAAVSTLPLWVHEIRVLIQKIMGKSSLQG